MAVVIGVRANATVIAVPNVIVVVRVAARVSPTVGSWAVSANQTASYPRSCASTAVATKSPADPVTSVASTFTRPAPTATR